MTSTQKGGGGFLKLVTCLWIPFFSNNRSIAHFAYMEVVGGSFFGHIWVTSNTIISKKANVWNRNTSDIPEILIFVKCFRIPLV